MTWWLAAGAISAAQTEDHVQNPDWGLQYAGAVLTGSWSVAIRAKYIYTGTVQFLFDAQTGRMALGWGTPTQRGMLTTSAWTNLDFFVPHDAVYYAVSNGTNIQLYLNNVAIGSAVASGDDIGGSVTWRSGYNQTLIWLGPLFYGAVYNIALDATQRAALLTEMRYQPVTQEVKVFQVDDSWLAPAGVSSVYVDAWGAGGRGGDTPGGASGARGGGGGGAYAGGEITVNPGSSYTVTVGVGSASALAGEDSGVVGESSTEVLAKGGGSTTGSTGGTGGQASASIGTTKFSGGNGGSTDAGTGDGGAGGGGVAGKGTAGTAGTDSTTGTTGKAGGGRVALSPAGDGGRGGNQGTHASLGDGALFGGGGGGAGGITAGSASPGGLGANGLVVLTWQVFYYELAIQLTAATGADNFMDSILPTSNFATNTALQIGDVQASGTQNVRTLIKFPLTDIPVGALISVALMYLYESSASGTGSWDILVQRLLRDWVENQSTWNIWSTGNNWSTAGAGSDGNDRSATVSVTFNRNGTALLAFQEIASATFTDDVKKMFDGTYPNYGWLLHAPTAETVNPARRTIWSSSDNVFIANAPFLVVRYTLPGGGGRVQRGVLRGVGRGVR